MTKVTCEHSGIAFESKDGWINAKDEIPKEGLRVLFVCNDLAKVLMGHHIKNGLMQFSPSINGQASNDNAPIIIDITHWMPLPSPPSNDLHKIDAEVLYKNLSRTSDEHRKLIIKDDKVKGFE